ncbi:HAMP domain-containing histidine kinase [Cyanobacteria bacterium FACHB-63]|nr:HAMP domain-containing histidine kinase [Cyanobacteria bacterium FACHB-63]
MKSTHQATKVYFTPGLEPCPIAQTSPRLIESEPWIAAIAQQSPDLIGMVSVEGDWRYLNPSGRARLGFSDRLPPFTALLSEAMFQLWHTTVLPQLWECGQWHGQLALESIWFDSQWFLIRDQHTDQLLGFATISRVIEAETKHFTAAESNLERNCERYLANAAHELRAPLAVMSSSIDLLTHDRLPIERSQKHFHRLRSKIQQMTQMLDDILLCREPAEFTLQVIDLDPVERCTDWIEEAQMTTDRHKILFTTESAVSSIRIDAELLQRILANLLSNSIKYSPQGGNILCRMAIDTNQLTLQVQDSGIGIPSAEHSQVFQSFYRASNAAGITGTGLGLAIVKQCVDRLGGQITVSSTEQTGTCFTVTIPL